jgi:hypothetical protein
MATSPNEDFDDDMTEATATVDLDSVRPTYTTDEVKRMKFTLIVNHNRRSLDGQFVGVTARWYVSLDNQEIGLGYSPFRCPYLDEVIRSLLTGSETTEHLNPWDFEHGETVWESESVAAVLERLAA